MQKRNLFTVNGASDALEKDRRAVAKALRGVAPDQTKGGLNRWRLAKIVDALANHGGDHKSAESARASSELVQIADEIESAAVRIDCLLGKLRKARTVGERRTLAAAAGGAVGALDRAHGRAVQALKGEERALAAVLRDRIVAGLVIEVAALCRWNLGASR